MKVLILVACLLLLGFSTYMVMPIITEEMINQDCLQTGPTPECLSRMRAAGHIRSERGDLFQAKSWYLRAAEHGDPIAMFHLAWVYEELAQDDLLNFHQSRGGSPIVEDSPFHSMESSQLVSAIEDSTIPPALKLAGNWTHAKTWYLKSANLGFSPSMNNLARMYSLGLGGTKDTNRAYYWYADSTNAGNPVSAINISLVPREAGRSVRTGWRTETWIPKSGLGPDISKPTLARTRGLNFDLPESARSRIREAAKNGKTLRPMGLIQKPIVHKVHWGVRDLEPNPNLPTFDDVVEKMKDSD